MISTRGKKKTVQIAEGIPVISPEGRVTCITEPLYLTPGPCFIDLTLLKGGVRADYIEHAAHFDIEPYDIYGSGKIPERNWVVCLRKYRWSTVGSWDE